MLCALQYKVTVTEITDLRFRSRTSFRSVTIPLPSFGSIISEAIEKSMAGKFGIAVLLMTIAGVASAEKSDCPRWWGDCGRPVGPTPLRAPEIDPASGLTGLTLLLGGLTVLRSRRANTEK